MAVDQGGTDESTGMAAPADNRRDDMLRAALDVIAERGFTDTRIADVAERAGTSPALVIYYFQSKDNLLTEAIRLAEDRWFEQGVRKMQAIPDAVGRLEEIVAWICLAPVDDEFPDPWSLWIDLWARSQRHPEVARVREEFDARWRGAIIRAVTEGQDAGDLRADRCRRVRHRPAGPARRPGRADGPGRPGGRRRPSPCGWPWASPSLVLGFSWSGSIGRGRSRSASDPGDPTGRRQAVEARISATSSTVVSGCSRASRPTASPSQVVCMTNPVCSSSRRSDQAS